MMLKMEKELHSSWHNNVSSFPFLKDLHLLIENDNISDFNLADKKVHGRHCNKADKQARVMA